jgi:hypothetical protein
MRRICPIGFAHSVAGSRPPSASYAQSELEQVPGQAQQSKVLEIACSRRISLDDVRRSIYGRSRSDEPRAPVDRHPAPLMVERSASCPRPTGRPPGSTSDLRVDDRRPPDLPTSESTADLRVDRRPSTSSRVDLPPPDLKVDLPTTRRPDRPPDLKLLLLPNPNLKVDLRINLSAVTSRPTMTLTVKSVKVEVERLIRKSTSRSVGRP